MKTKAVLFTQPNQVEIGEVILPKLGSKDILIETHYSCISPGTDLRVLSGLDGNTGDWPFIPGYSTSGIVIETGESVQRFKAGDAAFCMGTQQCDSHPLTWGGHIAHAIVSEDSAFLIPDGVGLKEASLAKIASIAYHGLTRSAPQKEDKVAVIGLGPIGMLAAIFHHNAGADVVVSDLSEERLELARSFGLTCAPKKETLKASFAEHFPDGAEIIIDSTGVPAVLKHSMQLCKELSWGDDWDFGSKVLIQGSYADTFSVNYMDAFMKEARILLTRDNQPKDIRAVLELMKQGHLNLGRIISDSRPYTEAPETYEQLRSEKSALMTVAFEWKS